MAATAEQETREDLRPGSRWLPLDVLRGVAVLLVVGRHAPPVPAWAPDLLLPWRRVGWSGVYLFFVLSGFLISGLLFSDWLRHGRLHVRRFWVRRAFKILPPCYLLLLLSLIWRWVDHPMSGEFLRLWLASLFYVQNYLGGLWAHLWSLAVEEHFYLLLPLVLHFLARRGEARPFAPLARAIPWVGVAVLLGRYAAVAAADDPDNLLVLLRTHYQIDSLLWGVGIGYLYWFERARLEHWVRARRSRLWLVGLALFAPFAMVEISRQRWLLPAAYTLVALGSTALLLVALFPRELRAPGLPARALARIGRDSYAIYLWHLPLRSLLDQLLPAREPNLVGWLADLALYLLATLLVSRLATAMVEQPLLALRDRWYPSPAKEASLSAAEQRAGQGDAPLV